MDWHKVRLLGSSVDERYTLAKIPQKSPHWFYGIVKPSTNVGDLVPNVHVSCRMLACFGLGTLSLNDLTFPTK